MKLLLDDYKKTAKITRALKQKLDYTAKIYASDIDKMINDFKAPKESDDGRSDVENRFETLREKERVLKQDQEIVNGMVSSLAYSIHCIRYNAEPPVARGIERRAYYEREIPFENQWIERRKDKEAEIGLRVQHAEKNEEEQYEEEIRNELVKEIKKCLTPRQIEVMELVGMDFTPRDIADMLCITKRAVNYAIESARKKVKDEGWRMV